MQVLGFQEQGHVVMTTKMKHAGLLASIVGASNVKREDFRMIWKKDLFAITTHTQEKQKGGWGVEGAKAPTTTNAKTGNWDWDN